MDHFQGITAEIISNGRVLKLYDDPEAAETEEGRSRYHYVEAMIGSPFQVKVKLTSQSNFYKMDHGHTVSILLKIDGRNDSSLVIHCTKNYLQGQFSRGESADLTFTGPTECCKETGQWMLNDYAFGNLVLSMLGPSNIKVKSDDLLEETSDPEFSVNKAQELGKIQVTIKRVRMVKRQIPFVPSTAPIATINEIPEKALKGRPIEATVG